MKKNLLVFGLTAVLSLSVFSPASSRDVKINEDDLATCKVYSYDQDGSRQLIAKCFACNCAALTRAVRSSDK